LLILDLGQLDRVTWMSLKFTVGHLVERIRYRELMEIITCSSPPLECIAMSYTRGLTCYQSLKYYFVHLH